MLVCGQEVHLHVPVEDAQRDHFCMGRLVLLGGGDEDVLIPGLAAPYRLGCRQPARCSR